MARQYQRKARQERIEGNDERRVVRGTNKSGVPELWKPDYAGQAKTLARLMVEDPIYLTGLRERMRAGTVAPAVENMVWERAFGKVKEEVEVRKIESIRIVHEYLEDSRESQKAAIAVIPVEAMEAKLLGEHTEPAATGDGTEQGNGDTAEVVTPSGPGDAVPDEVSGSGGIGQKRQDDSSDLEAD